MKLSTKPAAIKGTIALTSAPPQLLIIGYGNSLRSDDGAGIALAEKLAGHLNELGLKAKLMTSAQLLPEMAAEISAAHINKVVFIDTCREHDGSGIEIRNIGVDTSTQCTGHQLSPATLLLYAVLLYGRNPDAWLVTIPGFNFSHGESFSTEVRSYMQNITSIAHDLLQVISG